MSESWYDVKLKEIFNNTCKGYIELETNSLNNLILLMERFSMKLASIEEFENLYK